MFRRTVFAALLGTLSATLVPTSASSAADTPVANIVGYPGVSGAGYGALPEAVSRLLQAARIPPEAVGIVVQRGERTLIAHNVQLSMQPGSTMKLFTTLAALEQLGPTFRGRTELRSGADIVNGVLQGDLIVRGGADADFNDDVLAHMLQALRNQGIHKIKGDIVLDRQLFQPARPDVDVPPFDEFPWAYYNVIPDALLINSNLLKLEMRSTGDGLSVAMSPEMEKVSVNSSDLKLIDAPCAGSEAGWRAPDVARKGGKIVVQLHGTFPKNCVKATSINVLDRHDYLERLLRATWSRLGGSLSGEVREAAAPGASQTNPASQASPAGQPGPVNPANPAMPAPPATRLLADHVSRSLPEILRDTNKQSDNTLARTIFLSLGSLEADAMLGSHPLPASASSSGNDYANSSAARADAAIRTWLRNHNISEQGLVLDNGSGLSRLERATPAQLAAVLRAGQQSLWMPEFLASLPIAGVDGTMRKRLKDSPAALRARIKTGSLSGVIAIAGYVQDAGNQSCIVVAMLNHEQVANGAGRAVLDALLDWVARASAGNE